MNTDLNSTIIKDDYDKINNIEELNSIKSNIALNNNINDDNKKRNENNTLNVFQSCEYSKKMEIDEYNVIRQIKDIESDTSKRLFF